MNPILEIRDVCKEFVGVKALDHVSFSCYAGSVHVLQGENGAGKSTILKIISGLYRPDHGEILFNGKSIVGCHPNEIRQMGIAMVYQELTVLPELTVAQNIFLNQEHKISDRRGLLREKLLREKAAELANQYGISITPYAKVKDLSVAQQQIVEILKALALEPKVLILDEPTSALAFEEVSLLHKIVTRIRDNGAAVLFISHRMEEIFRFGDRMTVLKDGCVVDTVDMKSVTSDDVIRMMVGRELSDIFPKKSIGSGQTPLFEVRNVSVPHYVHDASFQVMPGEVLGIAALQGQGQTELLEAIGGLRHRQSGTLFFKGDQIHANNLTAAVNEGIVYVPEDRKQRGLFLDLPIRENITMGSLKLHSIAGIVNKKSEQAVVADMVKRMNIKARSVEQYVGTLSGGNQQKVVIGKALAANPKVILFNEPTRGIDVEAKQEIYRLIRSLVESGTAVILYSSDIMEIIGLCDCVLTLYEGRVTAVLSENEITEEAIMYGATGNAGGEIDAE